MTTFSFTTKASCIENSLEAVGKVRERAVLVVGECNISFKTVDPQNVTMCGAQVQSESIKQVERKDTTSQSEVTIKPSELQTYLSPADESDRVTLTYNEGESIIEGQINTQNLEFSFPVHIEPLDNIPETVPKEQQIERELNGSDLKRTIQLFSAIFDKGDFVEFQIENTPSPALRMIAENDDGRKISRSFELMQPPTPDSSVSTNKEGRIQSTKVGIKYLSDFAQIFGKSGTVTVHLGNEYPVRFELKLNSDVEIVYVIAPRTDE